MIAAARRRWRRARRFARLAGELEVDDDAIWLVEDDGASHRLARFRERVRAGVPVVLLVDRLPGDDATTYRDNAAPPPLEVQGVVYGHLAEVDQRLWDDFLSLVVAAGVGALILPLPALLWVLAHIG